MTTDRIDIWRQTFKQDPHPRLADVTVMTVITERHDGSRKLIARANIDTTPISQAIRSSVEIDMTADDMRDLAAMLLLHANRIDNELTPLLAPKSAAHAVPVEIPQGLYHEPEAA